MSKHIVEDERWEHAGFTCRLVGLDMGHRCGYVLIPDGHPWHAVNDTRDGPLGNVDVHGGVTWTGPLDPDDNWWIGFDCAHLGDAKDPALMPAEYRALFAGAGRDYASTVKSAEYVKGETNRLAEQARAAANVGVV